MKIYNRIAGNSPKKPQNLIFVVFNFTIQIPRTYVLYTS